VLSALLFAHAHRSKRLGRPISSMVLCRACQPPPFDASTSTETTTTHSLPMLRCPGYEVGPSSRCCRAKPASQPPPPPPPTSLGNCRVVKLWHQSWSLIGSVVSHRQCGHGVQHCLGEGAAVSRYP
jgi:hypothetical protein